MKITTVKTELICSQSQDKDKNYWSQPSFSLRIRIRNIGLNRLTALSTAQVPVPDMATIDAAVTTAIIAGAFATAANTEAIRTLNTMSVPPKYAE